MLQLGGNGGMSMLKSITLENYKCFKDRTTIDIAPLTVLCGVNSSGKSSVLKSLLMMKQTVENQLKDFAVSLSGDLVDCGEFDEVVYNGKDRINNTFTISNKFKIKNHRLDTTGEFVKRSDATAFNELRRMYFTIKGDILEFNLEIEIVLKKNLNENELLDFFSNNKIEKYKVCISAIDNNNNKIPSYNGYIEITNDEDGEHHLLNWENIPGYARAFNSCNNYNCICSFSGLSITNIFAYNMPNGVKSIVPNILAISRIIASQYNNILYIAPLRNTPERTYLLNKNVNSVGIAGQYTPQLLAKIKNTTTISDMFCPYTNDLEIDEHGYCKSKYLSFIRQWFLYFELGHLDILGENRTVNLKINNRNIADIGFGISQILPIITQGICMDKGQTLLIEQPEIHLHPKMELQMADFLLHIANTDRNVVVETHSEHIINRIVRRILEDDTRKLQNKVKIYFVEQNKVGNDITSKINTVLISDEYGIQNYPKDFFDQSAEEQIKIMRSGLSKRNKIRDGMI